MDNKIWLTKVSARVALGIVWFYEGLIPKILFLRSDELDLVQRSGFVWRSPEWTLLVMGVAQIAVGLWLIIGWAERLAVTVATGWMLILIVLVAGGNPWMLTDPYGALVKDFCLIACAIAVGYWRRSLGKERSSVESMFFRLKRHPIAVCAFFRYSLILTYALPRTILEPLLPPGLKLDVLGDNGFLAIALVQTKSLRPAGLPKFLGQNFFLSGYRIFTRFTTPSGRTLRGLRILRSDTNRRLMSIFGNLLTHYHYRCARVLARETEGQLEIAITTADREGDLHLVAQIDHSAERLPPDSPFADFHQARLFAGPLPFTFDHEPETDSIVMIEGVRKRWNPRPVEVDIFKNTFFEREAFRHSRPILANAFYVTEIDYQWKRGIVQRLNLN